MISMFEQNCGSYYASRDKTTARFDAFKTPVLRLRFTRTSLNVDTEGTGLSTRFMEMSLFLHFAGFRTK